jgi:hypothetical protein
MKVNIVFNQKVKVVLLWISYLFQWSWCCVDTSSCASASWGCSWSSRLVSGLANIALIALSNASFFALSTICLAHKFTHTDRSFNFKMSLFVKFSTWNFSSCIAIAWLSLTGGQWGGIWNTSSASFSLGNSRLWKSSHSGWTSWRWETLTWA